MRSVLPWTAVPYRKSVPVRILVRGTDFRYDFLVRYLVRNLVRSRTRYGPSYGFRYVKIRTGTDFVSVRYVVWSKNWKNKGFHPDLKKSLKKSTFLFIFSHWNSIPKSVLDLIFHTKFRITYRIN